MSETPQHILELREKHERLEEIQELRRQLSTEKELREKAEQERSEVIRTLGIEAVASRTYKQRAEAAERALKELSQLLAMAACPNCDGSGAKYVGDKEYVSREMALDAGCLEMEGSVYREPEVEQCQWCDEKQKALAAAEPLLTKEKA